MPAIWAAGITAAAGVAGNYMSSQGAMGINAQNAALAGTEADWQAYQAQMNRNFNAQQAAKTRAFQEGTLTQTENYNTMMANTAEQRRVADLKAAGLNPLLAATAGAAQAPVMSPLSGATASSAAGGGGPLPAMQNPNASWGNLGAQAASALALNQQSAQIDLLKAQAKKTTSETPSGAGIDKDGQPYVTVGENHDLGDANLANIQAQTGVAQSTANQVKANVDFIHTQITNTDADTALKNTQQLLSNQNLQVLEATKQYLIQQAAAAGAQAQNLGDVQSGTLGKVLAYLNAILHPVSSAVGIVGAIK